jgi:hypothetical protein
MSFKGKSINIEIFEIWQLLVISESGKFNIVWRYIDIVMCIVTSYYYAYLGAFYVIGDDSHNTALWVLDVFYSISMIISFLTDFTPLGETMPVRNIKKIALCYLKGEKEDLFYLDFTTWVPIRLLVNEHPNWRFVFFIKCIRIVKANEIFNIKILMRNVKNIFRKQSEARSKLDPRYGED